MPNIGGDVRVTIFGSGAEIASAIQSAIRSAGVGADIRVDAVVIDDHRNSDVVRLMESIVERKLSERGL